MIHSVCHMCLVFDSLLLHISCTPTLFSLASVASLSRVASLHSTTESFALHLLPNDWATHFRNEIHPVVMRWLWTPCLLLVHVSFCCLSLLLLIDQFVRYTSLSLQFLLSFSASWSTGEKSMDEGKGSLHEIRYTGHGSGSLLLLSLRSGRRSVFFLSLSYERRFAWLQEMMAHAILCINCFPFCSSGRMSAIK